MPNANPHGKRWGVRSNPTPSLTLRSAGGVARDGGPHVLPQLRAADGHQCRECLRAQPLRHIPSAGTQWVCPSVVETSANELRPPAGSDMSSFLYCLASQVGIASDERGRRLPVGITKKRPRLILESGLTGERRSRAEGGEAVQWRRGGRGSAGETGEAALEQEEGAL